MASLFTPRHYVEPSCMADGELVLTDDSTNDYDDDVLSLEGSSNGSVLSDVTTGTFASLGHTLYRLVDKWHAYQLRGEASSKRDGDTSSSLPNGGDLPFELTKFPPHFSPLLTPHGVSISMADCSWQGPSIEVVPTDSIEDIMPLWKSERTRDNAEWEERRKGLLAIDDELKRSRSQSDLVTDRECRVPQRTVPSTTGKASINLPPFEVLMNEWNKFFQEKENNKFNEVAIEVCSFYCL